jgi:hypothetical protein
MITIYDADRMASRPLPHLRYADQRRHESEVIQHPSNVQRGRGKDPAAAEVDGPSEEEESGSWRGEGDQEYFEVDFTDCAKTMMCAGTSCIHVFFLRFVMIYLVPNPVGIFVDETNQLPFVFVGRVQAIISVPDKTFSILHFSFTGRSPYYTVGHS